MKKIVGLLLVCAAALAVSGCGKDEKSQLREQFVKACTSQGAATELCNCVYDKLENQYGAEGLAKINTASTPPADFIEKTIEFTQQCAIK